jgi:hypothetical protein
MRMDRRSVIASLLLVCVFALTGAVGLACDKNFKVYNDTDKSMTKFFVSPEKSDNWEENVLSGDIEPDTSLPVDMTSDTRNNSLYDVKAVFDDGTKSEGYKINLCRARSIHIYVDKVTYTE